MERTMLLNAHVVFSVGENSLTDAYLPELGICGLGLALFPLVRGFYASLSTRQQSSSHLKMKESEILNW